MKPTYMLTLVATAILLSGPLALAADSPTELIVGKWQVRRDESAPDNSPIEGFEFFQGGKARVMKLKGGEELAASELHWESKAVYGNAIVLKITRVGSPAEAKPIEMLLAFDGVDAIVFPARGEGVAYMDRIKSP